MEKHDGDCTIYAAIINGNATDGMCTCGYGRKVLRETGSQSEMYSEERVESLVKEEDPIKKIVCKDCGTLTVNVNNTIFRCPKFLCGKTWYEENGRIISSVEFLDRR